MKPGAFEASMRPFCEDLCLVIAEDQPHSMTILGDDKLKALGGFDAALAAATPNLMARSPNRFQRIAQGFFVSEYRDDYDASRILLPRLFEQLPIKGSPVAVVMSRNCVLVCGADDFEGQGAMVDFIRASIDTDPRAIGSLAIRLEQGQWAPWTADPEDLGASPLQKLSSLQRARDYAEQKAALDRHFAETGTDIFVASALSANLDDGRSATFCVWTPGVLSLLPQTDVVFVGNADGRKLLRTWDDAEACGGPLRAEAHLYPPRFRVEDAPPGPAFEALAARPIPEWWPPPTADSGIE
jgi:hypothetical protein